MEQRSSTRAIMNLAFFSPFFVFVSFFWASGRCVSVNEYLAERELILKRESEASFGGQLMLNDAEREANDVLMDLKWREYDETMRHSNFPPSMHFFQAKRHLLQSQVYRIIEQMPKGGALHLHALYGPMDFVINDASHRDHLYICDTDDVSQVEFRFALSEPADLANCSWQSVAAKREQMGSPQFDAWLHGLLSLNTDKPRETYPDANSAWTAFELTLKIAGGIVCYAPVFGDYVYQSLLSFHRDNVQYAEIRTTLTKVYLLDGTRLDPFQIASIFDRVLHRFRRDFPTFGGAKIIFAPVRRVNGTGVEQYLDLVSQLKIRFPDLVAGFDLVGQEDLGPPLKDFLLHLLDGAADPELHYFFHAGETDWQGTTVDENLIDAILLNTSRIGHGFAIAKHPVVRELARSRGIPVEICPISNQVLGLVEDLRDHPAAVLFAENFPIVISSDNNAAWGAIGLSCDFYMAFMALSGRRSDLRMLKQLAINSIQYSAMNSREKTTIVEQWQRRWDSFISWILSTYQSGRFVDPSWPQKPIHEDL